MAISEQTDRIKPSRFTADVLPHSANVVGGFYRSLICTLVAQTPSVNKRVDGSSSSRSCVSKNGHFHGISLDYARHSTGGVFGGVV